MRFDQLLNAELQRRRARNSRYSLRAFARDLDEDHASLSQMLRGRRRPSARRMREIAARLGIDRAVLEACCAMRIDAAVLEAVQRRPRCIGSRRIARRIGCKVDDINVALQRLLVTGRLRMPTRDRWIVEENRHA